MSEKPADDPQLVARLKTQDRAAFSQLVSHYHAALEGFCASIAGASLAEDIMQDAWVAIWKGLPGFAGRSALTTWMYTIVRNESTARLKKEGRYKQHQEPVANEDRDFESWIESNFAADGHWLEGPARWHLDSPDAMLEEQQLQDCLEHNIEDLKPAQQSVFRLRDIEQMSLDEICNILQLSHSNVRVLLHRARNKLLRVIDHYQETGEC